MSKPHGKKDMRKKSVIKQSKDGRQRKRDPRDVEAKPIATCARHIPKNPWTLKWEKRVPFTRKVAKTLAGLQETEFERRLTQKHIDHLAQEVAAGRFNAAIVILATAYCAAEGVTYRINSQHCCSFHIEYMPADWAPMVTRQHYSVKAHDDLRKLYAAFDRGKSRTPAQIIQTRVFGVPAFDGIQKRTVQQLAAGFKLYKWTEQEVSRHSIDEVADLMTNGYQNLSRDSATVLGTRKKEYDHVMRAPVIAAIFATTEKNKKASHVFWQGVREGIGLTKRSPQLKLRDYLQTRTVNTGRGAGKKATTSREGMYRVCVGMWNAWREGREVSQVKYVRSPSRPKVLK